MYRTIDASYRFPAIIAFVGLILVGSQLSLNIVLAVISNSLDSIESDSDADIDKEEQSFGAKLSKSRHKNQTQSALVSHIQWLVDSKVCDILITHEPLNEFAHISFNTLLAHHRHTRSLFSSSL